MSEVTIDTNTIQNTFISDTIKIEENVTITEPLKPFRCSNYDKYDILYAAHMKTMYKYVENDIKEEFNIFTENLINENSISRDKLLNAIDTFKYQYKLLKNNDTDTNNDYSNWLRFTDAAFNYRPYQPCVIS
jgi:hypothetical protein